MKDGGIGYLTVLALCAILLFTGLGSTSLWDIDETSNARAADEMLLSGDWVVPTLNGELRTDKPPLHYWFMMASYKVFGVREYSARLFAAVFGFLTVLLTIWAGRRAFGAAAGNLSGLCLAVSFLFTVSSRSATTDAFLLFFTNLAVFAGFFAEGSRPMAILSWAAMGFAVLAKGPVGVVLPFGALLLYTLIAGRGVRGLRSLLDLGGILIFLGIAAPWYYLAASRTGGGLIEGFILKHNVGRFLNPMESHRGPFFYYLLILLLGFFPWAAFLPQAVFRAFRMRKGRGGRDGFGLLLLIWSGLVIIFFSVAGTKLPTYILPAFPALAIMMGAYIQSLDKRHGDGFAGRTWSWIVNLLPAVLFPAALVVGFKLRTPDLLPYALTALPLTAAAVFGLFFHLRGRPLKGFRWAAAAAAVGALGIHLIAAPALEPYRMAPVVGREIARMAGPSDEAAEWGYFRPSLVFYAKRHVERIQSMDGLKALLRRRDGRFLVTTEGKYRTWPGSLKGRLKVLKKGVDAADSNKVILLLERSGAEAPEMGNVSGVNKYEEALPL